MTISIDKWDQAIHSFEEEVKKFNLIMEAKVNPDELEKIHGIVKRQLENLTEYSGYASLRHRQIQKKECCDPTPRQIWGIGLVNGTSKIFAVGGATIAFFGPNEAVKWTGFVLFTGAVLFDFCTVVLSTKFSLENEEIKLVSRINQEKLSDFKNFEAFLNDYRQLQQMQILMRQGADHPPFSKYGENKQFTEKVGNDEINLPSTHPTNINSIRNDGDHQNNICESLSELNEKENEHFLTSPLSNEASSTNQKTSHQNVENSLKLSNEQNETIIIIEKKREEEDFFQQLPKEKGEYDGILEQRKTSTRQQANECAINLETPLLNNKITKCLKKYEKLPERFRSLESYEHVFSSIIQQLPPEHELLEKLNELCREEEREEKLNQSPKRYTDFSSPQTFSSNEGKFINEQNNCYIDHTSSIEAQSVKKVFLNQDRVEQLKTLLKSNYKLKNMVKFINLPDGTQVDLSGTL